MVSQYYCIDKSHLNQTKNLNRGSNNGAHKAINKKFLSKNSGCSISSDSDLQTTKNSMMTNMKKNPGQGSQNFDDSSLQISSY